MSCTDAPCHCPLCGQANGCAIAAGAPAQDCWCMTTPVARTALARLPQDQRGQRCLCPHCASGAPAVPAESPHPGATPVISQP
ncbi:Cysteine-rich CWC [Oryzisolibacter propanilivorax]|uniref:Cysteine-rich CWC n=1 Tax=Oryzisolibacter propanilivorax TaxID=1527607 RepID=A0A1G9VR93_9BURK|nr:cysteine-rich CWC family protein [Oryzisolibacter propanilivorax]SDM74365.1 Cysteine-rich CWC [Oryzisolibacter propanilivorax]